MGFALGLYTSNSPLLYMVPEILDFIIRILIVSRQVTTKEQNMPELRINHTVKRQKLKTERTW
jgi:hypothetical protein